MPPDHPHLLSFLVSSIVRISLLRPTADEMELQALAALNIGRASLNIAEVVWQTVFVSPNARALPTFTESPITVFENSTSLFSNSPHEICGACSLHPASKSGTITRQGVAGNLRIAPLAEIIACQPFAPRALTGREYVRECQGCTATPKKALARLVNAVFADSDKVVVRHTFSHPAATSRMQRPQTKSVSERTSPPTLFELWRDSLRALRPGKGHVKTFDDLPLIGQSV